MPLCPLLCLFSSLTTLCIRCIVSVSPLASPCQLENTASFVLPMQMIIRLLRITLAVAAAMLIIQLVLTLKHDHSAWWVADRIHGPFPTHCSKLRLILLSSSVPTVCHCSAGLPHENLLFWT